MTREGAVLQLSSYPDCLREDIQIKSFSELKELMMQPGRLGHFRSKFQELFAKLYPTC
jgi:hypothetical protein